MIKKRLIDLKNLIVADIHKPLLLARSVAVGVYIAFAPFPGLHTILVFLLGWLFSLSIPIVFAVSILLHNPWTMFFCYAAGYITGEFFCTLFTIEANFLEKHLQIISTYIPFFEASPSMLLKILIGGNVFGIVIALIIYPVIKYYAVRYQKN